VETLRRDRDVSVRTTAVSLLGRLGPAAKPAVPALLPVLGGDEDLRLRLEVARSLQRIELEHRVLQHRLKSLELALANQLSDAALGRIVSELESLIAEHANQKKQTRRFLFHYRLNVLD
jgi:HEAT repeat protein